MRIGSDVPPKHVDLIVVENALPWRHLAFTGEHRILKPRTVLGLQAAQVEGLARTDQPLTVAGETIGVVKVLSGLDFCLILCRCYLAGCQERPDCDRRGGESLHDLSHVSLSDCRVSICELRQPAERTPCRRPLVKRRETALGQIFGGFEPADIDPLRHFR
jgi:hypothetical protein